MVKLSFIVPIYNVKDYLRKCVDSLLCQDYDDYEIILIDDGSTDGSGELADELSTLDSRLSAFHQPNRGLSAARNKGIELASGEYICFVDSDDYWEENVLGGLMAQIERDDLDVLRFRWQNVREDGMPFWPYKDNVDYNDYSSVPVNGLTFLNERMDYRCYAVQFIVRKSLLSNLCLFTEEILFEDTDWTPRMLMRANRVASADMIVYNYLWREGSITLNRSMDKIKKELENKISLIYRLKDWNQGPWFEGMISMLMVSVTGILSESVYSERHKYLEQLRLMPIFPLSTFHLNKRTCRKIYMLNFNLAVAIWLLHNKNK